MNTPSKLLLGYDQRNHSDFELQQLIRQLQEIDINIGVLRSKARDTASVAKQNLQRYNKEMYDRRHKRPALYKEGDLVMIRDLGIKSEVNQKLLQKFKGPYKISKVLNNNRYVVTDVPGYQMSTKQ